MRRMEGPMPLIESCGVLPVPSVSRSPHKVARLVVNTLCLPGVVRTLLCVVALLVWLLDWAAGRERHRHNISDVWIDEVLTTAEQRGIGRDGCPRRFVSE